MCGSLFVLISEMGGEEGRKCHNDIKRRHSAPRRIVQWVCLKGAYVLLGMINVPGQYWINECVMHRELVGDWLLHSEQLSCIVNDGM